MKGTTSVEQALEMLLDRIQPLGEEYVPLIQCLQRVISQDLIAGDDVPGFNRSPLDGYALRGMDTGVAKPGDPVSLKILEEVPAGYTASQAVAQGTAVKVMTGAPIPQGADAVVRFEDVTRKDNAIEVLFPLKPGSNLILAGEDVRKGEITVSRGTIVTPPLIGVLASLGISEVPVFIKPKVAIISTGDELVDVQASLKPGQIHNSNSYCLAAHCLASGLEPLILENARDDKGDLSEKILHGLNKADLVIITGGVSVGDYDFTPGVLVELGADILFWGVDIKPGAPSLAAVLNGKVIIALSGNPASALVVYQILAVPVLKKLMGQKSFRHSAIHVVIKDGFKKNSPQRRFLRGRLSILDGEVGAILTGAQSNGILKSMIGCNLLIDVPAGSGPIRYGDKIQALVIE